MPILINNRMDTLDILENIVFWCLVIYIAWNEKNTPAWAFVLLFVFVIYLALRFIFKKQGMDRAVWLYSLNMVVVLYLLYYFLKN